MYNKSTSHLPLTCSTSGWSRHAKHGAVLCILKVYSGVWHSPTAMRHGLLRMYFDKE